MNIILAGNFKWSEKDYNELARNGKNNIFICPNEQEDIPISLDEVDAVVCNWFFKYHDLMMFKKLKYIQLLSVGYNGIDPILAQQMGIVVKNAKDVYSIPISEFVIGNLLAVYKNLPFFWENQGKRKWEKNRDLQELYDKKVLILGTGSIGTEIAKRLSAFTRHVFGCNRTVRDIGCFAGVYPLHHLDAIISDFDVLIVTIALTDETRHLLGKPLLERMKPDALLINVSRGAVIDEAALVDALQRNKLGGVILDVFEEEPLQPENALWQMNNVILTPHNSFVSDKNNERLRSVIWDNFRNWENYNGKTSC